jgi:hypothetical protein
LVTRKLSKEKKAKPPLTVTHPDAAAQWHPTLNNGLKSENFTHGSQKRSGGYVVKIPTIFGMP